MAWEFPHWNSQREQERNATECNSDCEGCFQTDHVRLKDPRKYVRRKYILQLRGAGQKYKAGIHSRGRMRERGKQSVDKSYLSR
jgi:hypothetical protein